MNENQELLTPDMQQQAAAPQQEKMLPQSEVNKLVGAAKAQAEQRGREQAEMQHQAQMEAVNKVQQQHQQAGAQQIDANAMYQQLQERFNADMKQKQLEAEIQQVAHTYMGHVEKGKQTYNDFDEITKDFDPGAFPQLVYLVAGIPNGSDIIYDLAKNPMKLAALDRLAEKNPRQAQAELAKLSASISTNQQASTDAQGQDVNAPLDSLRPSRQSGSSDKSSIRDLRSQPWLRG